jgi:hypothetical protein
MLTFAELLAPETTTAIADSLRARLLEAGLPTGSWAGAPIGMENLRVEAVAVAIQAFCAKRVAAIAKGGTLATADDVDGKWLSYLGQEVYRMTLRPASKTRKWIALYSTAGAAQPAYDFDPGDLIVRSPATGRRYVNVNVESAHFDGTKVLPAGASNGSTALVLPFEAEAAGAAYADPAGTITEMVTARAGVQCSNIRPFEFEPAILLGSSGGTISASFTSPATAPSFASVVVRIDTAGDLGGGAWSWIIPGGSWTPGGPLEASTVIPGGATISMANGQASPSFHKGDLFVLMVGSDVALQGADVEDGPVFAAMCAKRHQQITRVMLGGAIELLARAASPEVARVFVDADPFTSGLVIVTAASSVGPASPAALRAIQAFIAPRLRGYQGVPAATATPSPAERVIAQSARPLAIAAAGTAFVPAAQLAAAKVAASDAWLSYLGRVALGNGDQAVEYARLIQIVTDAGADDVDDGALNGGTDDIAIPEGMVPVLAAGDSLATSLTWVPT